MNMFERFKGIFASPSQLYTDIKAEADYKPTLIYYLVFVLGLSVVSSIIGWFSIDLVGVQNTIVGWFTSVINILVFAFFISLVASWFGGTKSWVQGFKSAVYPGTIFAVFGLIIAILTLFVSLPDFTNPAALMANLGALIGVGIVLGLIALALLVWTIVLYVKGISIGHDVTGGKAFGTWLIAAIISSIVMWAINWLLTAIGLIEVIVPTFG